MTKKNHYKQKDKMYDLKPKDPPPGSKTINGCGKPNTNCRAPGWLHETNWVEYGETTVLESWEAWCSVHGHYGQSGSSGVVFDRPIDMTELEKAQYCGFKTIAEWYSHKRESK